MTEEHRDNANWFGTRRRFIVLAGAATAGITMGCEPASKVERYDVIIVGGGNAGLPAAIFAAERGAKVLIIEAAGLLGGTLHLSSGQMSAAGTKLQADKGIEDSPQSHYDDVMRISKGTANPEIAKLATFNAAETFDWITAAGLEVDPSHPITGTTHEPYSNARYAWANEGGRSILKVLNEQLEQPIADGRVSVLLNTKVTGLLQDKGAMMGVIADDESGMGQSYLADEVVLTCGGYASNPKMFAELEGAMDYADTTYEYSQGVGITLGVGAGGYVRGGEHHLPLFGAVLADDDYPSRMVGAVRPWPPHRPPWEIYVNAEGERFLREDIASHDAHEEALREQTEERCWVVFDEAIFSQAPQLVRGSFSGGWTQESIREAFESEWPMFYRGETVAELATAAGINGDGLAETIAAYNAGQTTGEDALGREHMPLPIAEPPFYAVQTQSWLLSGFAGLAVNDALQVIREDQTPIPGLYAAGELLGAAAFMGRSYCGGMLVTPALTFGRLLGQRLLALPNV